MTIERAIELQTRSWALEGESKLEEASRACREALQLMEAAEGKASPDVANLLNDLADIEQQRQNFAEALSLAERARSIEDALGQRFSGADAARIRARTLAIVGDLRRIQGKYAEAEGDLRNALAISAGEFGEASEEAAEARNNLAVLYKYWGRFDEGLELYGQALPAVIAAHGANSQAAATVYHNVGGILHARGDYTAAEAPARKAWEISRQLLGDDDPRTMLDATAYAGVLDGLKRYDESEAIYLAALAVFKQAYGPEHYEVAAALHNLAAVLAASGRYQQAEERYRQALAFKEKLLGANNPDVAITRNNLGKLLADEGRIAEGVPLLEAAVAALEARLPADHPHLLRARANLQNAKRALS